MAGLLHSLNNLNPCDRPPPLKAWLAEMAAERRFGSRSSVDCRFSFVTNLAEHMTMGQRNGQRCASPAAAGEAGGAQIWYSNCSWPPSGKRGRRLGAGALLGHWWFLKSILRYKNSCCPVHTVLLRTQRLAVVSDHFPKSKAYAATAM